MLLKKGADSNIRGFDKKTPLHYAVLIGNLENVSLLLKHGADPNIQGFDQKTPLHDAVLKEAPPETVSLLLEKRADTNIQDFNDKVPLHYAVLTRNFENVSLLLKHERIPTFRILLVKHFYIMLS